MLLFDIPKIVSNDFFMELFWPDLRGYRRVCLFLVKSFFFKSFYFYIVKVSYLAQLFK